MCRQVCSYLRGVVPSILRTRSDFDVRSLAKSAEILLEFAESNFFFEEKIPLYVEATGLRRAFDLERDAAIVIHLFAYAKEQVSTVLILRLFGLNDEK